jgi:hypothetical protein
MKIITLIFSLLILTGCNEATEIHIPGTYTQDKGITAPGKSKPAADELTLLDNHTFTLAAKDGSSKTITGKWELKESGNGIEKPESKVPQDIVRFIYDGKIAVGELKANIIQFTAPGGFRPDVFEYVLYVKAENN